MHRSDNDRDGSAAPAPEEGQKPADYSKSLYLPQTDFPMRAGLPKKEPELLARWREIGLYQRQREAGRRGRNSSCTTAPPTPMAISISAMRSTRS